MARARTQIEGHLDVDLSTYVDAYHEIMMRISVPDESEQVIDKRSHRP